MAKTANEVIHDVLELSEEDRSRVMSALVDSFELDTAGEPEGSFEDAKAYMAEVRKRIDDVLVGSVKGRPWREAMADLDAELREYAARRRRTA
ncbi:MAG: hypothetical protein FWD73_02375 [Polyangiaceae bacterium]|nr:hypothetical protein [Polyangiaceae bacterium]